MSRTFLIFALLACILVIEAYKVPTDAATQLKLKKRGQACMKRILPKNGPSKALQRELAVCFKVDCAMAIIPKVERQFPHEFPILKGCMGY
ncbi:unnamed protein product [Caenorhabditis nigoni]|uniref:Uncharacterized protein n=1 Tax=Caenorhabditis nigoni TaxID=1611254 RepID=A0A2G5U0C5_9PELO|nr:hypothetical protein B9Z55_013095 [Caenorhabditis nigoni]